MELKRPFKRLAVIMERTVRGVGPCGKGKSSRERLGVIFINLFILFKYLKFVAN